MRWPHRRDDEGDGVPGPVHPSHGHPDRGAARGTGPPGVDRGPLPTVGVPPCRPEGRERVEGHPLLPHAPHAADLERTEGRRAAGRSPRARAGLQRGARPGVRGVPTVHDRRRSRLPFPRQRDGAVDRRLLAPEHRRPGHPGRTRLGHPRVLTASGQTARGPPIQDRRPVMQISTVLRRTVGAGLVMTAALAMGATPSYAENSTQHSTFDPTGAVFSCANGDLSVTGGVIDETSRFATGGDGTLHITYTITPHDVTAEDARGTSYKITGASHTTADIVGDELRR